MIITRVPLSHLIGSLHAWSGAVLLVLIGLMLLPFVWFLIILPIWKLLVAIDKVGQPFIEESAEISDTHHEPAYIEGTGEHHRHIPDNSCLGEN